MTVWSSIDAGLRFLNFAGAALGDAAARLLVPKSGGGLLLLGSHGAEVGDADAGAESREQHDGAERQDPAAALVSP